MAVAIMGGLVVGTVLTLLALPAMYAAAYRVKPADQEKSLHPDGEKALAAG